MPGPEPTPDTAVVTGVQVWAEYTKDRFDFNADRVNELRNRARQLAAAIGVVIGLEMTLLPRFVLDVKPPFNRWLFSVSLLTLFSALACQIVLLMRLFERGYGWDKISGGPERPNDPVLQKALWKETEEGARKTLAIYYADASDPLYELTEGLTREVRELARDFGRSLALLFVSAVGLALLVALPKLGVS